MAKTLIASILSGALSIFASSLIAYDLTVIGTVAHADGLARISVGLIDLLKDDLTINCIPTYLNVKDINEDVQEIVLNPDKSAGRVSFFSSPLWYVDQLLLINHLPRDSQIKIAYSMLESTAIPPEWVVILNSHFDAVAVPDHFLVEVYKNSGVLIPIFELPLGMYLDDFFDRPKQLRPSYPFVFGSTVSCDGRKNMQLIIQAFAEEFGNSQDVVLRLNARQGDVASCKQLISTLGVSNIHFTHDVLDKNAYLDLISSFDCFINISKGEGFSLCPREALALGIPCILANNSSQITLCNSGLVRAVPSNLLEPTTYWGMFGGQEVGCFANCHKKDVKLALRDMYENYSIYLNKVQQGPKWVSQYAWQNLKKKYMSLIKPSKVHLGRTNAIKDKALITNSPKLYAKYKKLIQNTKMTEKRS